MTIGERELAKKITADVLSVLKAGGDNLAILNAVSAALRNEQSSWQPIETAPKEDPNRPGCMFEIMIAGGTFVDNRTMHGDMEFDGWTLACWDSMANAWRGENSGGHDEYYYHKPTHWMLKVAPPDNGKERG